MMRQLGRARVWWATGIAGLALACGSSGTSSSTGNPAAPSQASGPLCRTYATAANVRTTSSASNIVFNAIEVGSYDAATRKVTVDTKFANGAPCSTGVTSYNSVADFVDEVKVIPGVFLATGTTSTNSGACGNVTGSLTYNYDSQRRLIGTTPSTGASTTYTAWDSFGRPTQGVVNGGGTITNVYDNAARTQTQTQTASNAVTTLTFDANGIPVSSVIVQGGITSTTTFTTTSTATVCK